MSDEELKLEEIDDEEFKQEVIDRELEIDEKRASARKKIAYQALYFTFFLIVIVTGAALFGDAALTTRLEQLVIFMSTVIVALIGLVGAYMGMDKIKGKK